jgi:hypothetical protein
MFPPLIMKWRKSVSQSVPWLLGHVASGRLQVVLDVQHAAALTHLPIVVHVEDREHQPLVSDRARLLPLAQDNGERRMDRHGARLAWLNIRRISMRTLLGLGIAIAVLTLAGCKDQICSCQSNFGGPGWCQRAPNNPPGECQCPISVPCPGWCLPDGGNPNNPMPVPCDGGR